MTLTLIARPCHSPSGHEQSHGTQVSDRVTLRWPSVQFSSVAQSCPTLWDPRIAAHQASLSITNSRSLLKPMSIESVMPSSHLILCRPLLLLPPIPPSIRVFSNESTLCMGWPKYPSFSFSISPSNEHPGLISFRMRQPQRQAKQRHFILSVQGQALLHL